MPTAPRPSIVRTRGSRASFARLTAVQSGGIIGVVSALDELAAFLTSYCEVHAETLGAAATRGVALILGSDVLPHAIDKQAALYGFASEIGATRTAGFNPAWKPRHCI